MVVKGNGSLALALADARTMVSVSLLTPAHCAGRDMARWRSYLLKLEQWCRSFTTPTHCAVRAALARSDNVIGAHGAT